SKTTDREYPLPEAVRSKASGKGSLSTPFAYCTVGKVRAIALWITDPTLTLIEGFLKADVVCLSSKQ
ncbi:MAG: hypothetical protein IJ828_11330, partial [Treponema sp.]|nr:hypothetical protein [Treponema sp.]